MDLAMYASRRSPPLLIEEVSNYTPKKLDGVKVGWENIFLRLFDLEDDGHAPKLGRAVANAENVSKKRGRENSKIHGDMFLKIGNMVIDSVEDTGNRWVRSAGFEEAWENFEDRKESR